MRYREASRTLTLPMLAFVSTCKLASITNTDLHGAALHAQDRKRLLFLGNAKLHQVPDPANAAKLLQLKTDSACCGGY